MAYMSQQKKAQLAPAIKAVLKKYRVKGSLAVHNHSTLVLNIKSGPIDFVENYLQTDADKPHARKVSPEQAAYMREKQSLDVNPYWYQEHYTGEALAFLSEIIPAMKAADWYDKSDAQVDYFDTAYYFDVNVGSWNKPYTLTK